jgi:hypothetical protein
MANPSRQIIGRRRRRPAFCHGFLTINAGLDSRTQVVESRSGVTVF